MTPKCRKQMSMIFRGSRALVASDTSPRRGEVGSRLRARPCASADPPGSCRCPYPSKAGPLRPSSRSSTLRAEMTLCWSSPAAGGIAVRWSLSASGDIRRAGLRKNGSLQTAQGFDRPQCRPGAGALARGARADDCGQQRLCLRIRQPVRPAELALRCPLPSCNRRQLCGPPALHRWARKPRSKARSLPCAAAD
jgi:hypothetical protein